MNDEAEDLGYDPNDPNLTKEEREWKEHQRQKSRYLNNGMAGDLANVLASENLDDDTGIGGVSNGVDGAVVRGNEYDSNMDDATPEDDQNTHYRRPSWITGVRSWGTFNATDMSEPNVDSLASGAFGVELREMLRSNPNIVPIDEQQASDFRHNMEYSTNLVQTGLFGDAIGDSSLQQSDLMNGMPSNTVSIYEENEQSGYDNETDTNNNNSGKKTEIRINGYKADMPSIVRDEITRFKDMLKEKKKESQSDKTPQTGNSNSSGSSSASFTSASDSNSLAVDDSNDNAGAETTPKEEQATTDDKTEKSEAVELLEATVSSLERLGELWGTNISQWRKKYNKMRKKYDQTVEAKNTMEDNAAQLYDDLQKMNQSFYELWLEHRDLQYMHEEDNETHKRIIMQHKQRIVSITEHLWKRKNKERELIDRINKVSSHNRNISTLSQMLDEPFETYLRDGNIKDEFADLNNETAMELEYGNGVDNNTDTNNLNINTNMTTPQDNNHLGMGITDVTLATPPPSVANSAMGSAPPTNTNGTQFNSGANSVTHQSFSEMMVDGSAVYDVDSPHHATPQTIRISTSNKMPTSTTQNPNINNPNVNNPPKNTAQDISTVVENAFQNNQNAVNNNRRNSVTFDNGNASGIIRSLRMQLSDEKTHVSELESLLNSKDQELSEIRQDLESFEKNYEQLFSQFETTQNDLSAKTQEVLEYEEQIDVLCQQLGRSRSSLPEALQGSSYVQSEDVGHGKTAIRIPANRMADEFDFLSYNDDNDDTDFADDIMAKQAANVCEKYMTFHNGH